MPAQPVDRPGALGDQIAAVIEQQPDLHRLLVQIRDWEPLDPVLDHRTRDRKRVDLIGLARLALALARGAHPVRRDPLARGQQRLLEPPRDVPAVLDRPHPLLTQTAIAQGRLRAKIPALKQALEGRFEDHHAFLLERMLAHVEELEEDIEALCARIEGEIRPFEAAVQLLRSIPEVERRAAEVIIAEIGTDTTVFPTAGHLASWAGICPGQNESAGKRKSAKTRKGSKWLRKTLTESARAAARTKETYLAERYRRLAARRGDKKAIVAISHEILTVCFHMLQTGELYREQGADTLRRHDQDRIRRRAINQLEKLGLKVTLEALPEAA
jgi:transposase